MLSSKKIPQGQLDVTGGQNLIFTNTTEPVPVEVVTPVPPEATANVDDRPAAVPVVF